LAIWGNSDLVVALGALAITSAILSIKENQ
jgi:hypothetical protein